MVYQRFLRVLRANETWYKLTDLFSYLICQDDRVYDIQVTWINEHTTSNPRRFDVNITSIFGRPNFRVLFRCNFDGPKIHVVPTYLFRCNFAGPQIHMVSTYFFWCNFVVRNMHVVFTCFFRRNFDGQRFDIVFGQM